MSSIHVANFKPPANGASLSYYLVPKMLIQAKTWEFINRITGFGAKTGKQNGPGSQT